MLEFVYMTIFSDLLEGKDDFFPVWEDDDFIAFLTPYPNTPGLTIVIPKHNPGDYIFSISEHVYTNLLCATRKVAHILERALNVKRVALVFEGTGVAHVHAKLYPLYGDFAEQTDVWSDHVEFSGTYRKYITTVEGPRMDNDTLIEIQKKILNAQK